MTRKKILILRLSSIGDILLTTPFIRQVRTAFPKAQIDYVIKTGFSELLSNNPHLDNVYDVKPDQGIKGLLVLKKFLKKQSYDYVFDLHNNFRTKALTAFTNKNAIKKDKLKRTILVYTKHNRYNEIIPIPQRYLNVGKFAGIKDDELGLELFWKDETEKKIDASLNKDKINSQIIVLAPGAAHYTKRWPLEYFKELIEKISKSYNDSIVLLGSADERKDFDCLVQSQRVINFAGQLSLLESAAVLSRARLIISNDSGLMHMATAVKTPLIALFGSTVKELGFFPFRSEHIIVENTELNCRPCSHIGKSKCHLKHFQCMLEIKPNHIFKQIQTILDK